MESHSSNINKSNGPATTISRAWEVSAACAAGGTAAEVTNTKACGNPHPDNRETTEDAKSDTSQQQNHTSPSESQVQGDASPVAKKELASNALGMPCPMRRSSSDVDRIFKKMKTEISTVETNPRNSKKRVNLKKPLIKKCEKAGVSRDRVKRRVFDGKQLMQLEPFIFAVGEIISHQPQPDFRDTPSQMDMSETNESAYAEVCEIVNEIASNRLSESESNPNTQPNSRAVTPDPRGVGSTLPTLSEAPSYATRVTDSKQHQAPSWFQKMPTEKQMRLKATVLKDLEGGLNRPLDEELWYNFGLDKTKTAQVYTFVKATASSADHDVLAEASKGKSSREDEPSWVKLGGAKTSRRRRRRKGADDGQSHTTEVTDKSKRDESPAQRSEVSMSEVLSVASNGPTGFTSLKSSLKAIKAQQLREKTAGRQIDRILVELTKDNIESSAKKLLALMSHSTDLTEKAAKLIVHSQGKPRVEKQTPAQSKERAEKHGALLAGLVASLAPRVGEDFRRVLINEFVTECKKFTPPPKFSVVSMVGELHTPHKLVDDDFMHKLTKLMLGPQRRSHIQAISMMLGRCTPDWKHKQRLVFPHGIYDELKRQARTMGKPTYMGVKALAERTQPSWMDRQDEARERRELLRKQRMMNQNGPNWQHRRQPHQNWINNANRANNQHVRFAATEKAPSVASSGRGRRRTRRNRSRNQAPEIRIPSPARSDATLPVESPVTPTFSNAEPPADGELDMSALDMLPMVPAKTTAVAMPKETPSAPASTAPPPMMRLSQISTISSRASALDAPPMMRTSQTTEQSRPSARNLVAALNAAPSIRNMKQDDDLAPPAFSPAPMPYGRSKPLLDDAISIAGNTDVTEMGSIDGSEMRLELPTRPPWKERRDPSGNKEGTLFENAVNEGSAQKSKRSRRNKKKNLAANKQPASPAPETASKKKSRANRRGKRGGKRQHQAVKA